MTNRLLLLAPLLLAVSTLTACADDRCTKICKRVAFCKEEANKSPERVLGEREPPANRRCMERCRSESDAFKTCEGGSRRTCEQLRQCLGPTFDN